MTSRPSTAAPILAALAVVLVTLGAYVGGYFWLGEMQTAGFSTVDNSRILRHEDGIVRSYARPWHVSFFWPLGKIEAWLRGFRVELMSDELPKH